MNFINSKKYIMEHSDIKEVFILFILFMAILCVLFHIIEFFGCFDCCKNYFCKQSMNQINSESSQEIP